MLLVAAALSLAAGLAAAADKPHIVLIIVDDLGHTDLSHFGAEYSTPNLDSLFTEGLTLGKYYVQSTCTPTRSSLMTGRYPHHLGLQDVTTMPPATTGHIPMNETTVAEHLKRLGYRTAHMGKWHLGYGSVKWTPQGRGFDEQYGYYQGAEDYYTKVVFGGYDFWDNGQLDTAVNGTYSNSLYRARGLQTIREHKAKFADAPLFLTAAFQTIHAPIEYAPGFNATHHPGCEKTVFDMRTRYCSQMLHLDATVGLMIQELKAAAMWEDTLVLVTTDNGGMPPVKALQNAPIAHGCGSNWPLRAGKATTFEGGVQGLGAVTGGRLPEELRGTVNNRTLLHAIDIAPTIMAAAGVSGPTPGLDGLDIMNELEGPGHDHIIIHLNHAIPKGVEASAVRKGAYKYMEGKNLYDGYFNLAESAKQIRPKVGAGGDCQRGCLFNLDEDPLETNDLSHSPSHRDVLNELKTILADEIANNYMPNQNYTQIPAGLAQNNNGVWAPFLD